MYLHEQQRLYIQTIFEYFRNSENAAWPTFRAIEQEFRRIDRSLDIAEISKDLPYGFAKSFASDRKLDEQAVLSLTAIRECKNSEEDLENFIKAIRFFADIYFNAMNDDPVVTGEDLFNQLDMPKSDILRVGKIFELETALYIASGLYSVNGFVSWQYTLSREIRKFDGVRSIDEYLEKRDNPGSRIISPSDQLKQLLGYMYRKPGSEDIKSGFALWTKNLTETNEYTGTKLEVALLNALARLGVPTIFGGDIERPSSNTDKKVHSGPQTPVFDLVALNFGAPMQVPTAVLISCKSSKGQPKYLEISLVSDESEKVRQLLPGWMVFGALVNLGNPTSDDFQNRNDIRIWTQSDLLAILHARDYKYLADFLWTPPWHWKKDIEIMWWNRYKAYHKELFLDE